MDLKFLGTFVIPFGGGGIGKPVNIEWDQKAVNIGRSIVLYTRSCRLGISPVVGPVYNLLCNPSTPCASLGAQVLDLLEMERLSSQAHLFSAHRCSP